MELGGVYLSIALKLALAAFAVGFAFGGLVIYRLSRRSAVRLFVAGAIGMLAIPVACTLFLQPWFTAAHRAQNRLVPQGVECLSYQADPAHLEASYRMSREQFESWVNQHPWQLAPTDRVWFRRDGREVTEFEGLRYATPVQSDSDGGQMRAYHEEDTAYISYNAR